MVTKLCPMAKRPSELTTVRAEAFEDGIRAACASAMRRQGWSYRELAEATGVNYQHIYGWLTKGDGMTTMKAWPVMEQLDLIVVHAKDVTISAGEDEYEEDETDQ